MVIFMPQPLYPQKETQYPINMGLDAPQSQTGLLGVEKILLPEAETQVSTPTKLSYLFSGIIGRYQLLKFRRILLHPSTGAGRPIKELRSSEMLVNT